MRGMPRGKPAKLISETSKTRPPTIATFTSRPSMYSSTSTGGPNFTMSRSKDETLYKFSLEEGLPIKINFIAHLPLGMKVLEIMLDDQKINPMDDINGDQMKTTIPFLLSNNVVLKIRHKQGIGVLPHIPEPMPEDSSRGFKIIRERLNNSRYSLLLQGKSGDEFMVELMTFGQKISELIGAEIVNVTPDNEKVSIRVKFPAGVQEFSEREIIAVLAEG